MERALYSLYTRMKILNLTKLGISKIGCGFDEIEWDKMMFFIKKLFTGSGIHITVCTPSRVSVKNYRIFIYFSLFYY